MKILKANFLIIMCLIILLCLLVPSVTAQWSSLNSGYAVTTDYHGKNVPPGTMVTATAGTTDPDVKNVTFVWKYPNKTVAFTDLEVPVSSNGTTWNGKLIYYATSSYRPDVVGDWGVQAFFNGPREINGQGSAVIPIRATSFNVIPVASVVGTAGVLTAMLLGLSLFLRKRSR